MWSAGTGKTCCSTCTRNRFVSLPQELQKIAQDPQMLALVHPSVYLTPSLSGLLQMIPRTIASCLPSG